MLHRLSLRYFESETHLNAHCHSIVMIIPNTLVNSLTIIVILKPMTKTIQQALLTKNQSLVNHLHVANEGSSLCFAHNKALFPEHSNGTKLAVYV